MGQSKIVTTGPVFILSDVYLAVAVVIAKAPYYMHDDQWKLNPIKFAFLFFDWRCFRCRLYYVPGSRAFSA